MNSFHNVQIHPTAVVGKNVRVGEGTRIGPYCILGLPYLGANEPSGEVLIGANTMIGPHSVIYDDVVLEAGTILDPSSRVGPHARIGAQTRLLYGARVHEKTSIGSFCVIGGNCPDRTTFGDHVIHLGRIAHSYYYPFADWDGPAEPGPTLGSHVVIGVEALIIGPVHIGDNVFIFPREIVRKTLSGDGIFRNGQWQHMPNWAKYLRMLGKLDWAVSG